MATKKLKSSAKTSNHYGYEQIVYLLQGGGALGAYQAGVCEKLQAAGFEPDWVLGTSIGAIHSAIIAGNAPEDRVDALKQFWEKIKLPIPFFPFLRGVLLVLDVLISNL